MKDKKFYETVISDHNATENQVLC